VEAGAETVIRDGTSGVVNSLFMVTSQMNAYRLCIMSGVLIIVISPPRVCDQLVMLEYEG